MAPKKVLRLKPKPKHSKAGNKTFSSTRRNIKCSGKISPTKTNIAYVSEEKEGGDNIVESNPHASTSTENPQSISSLHKTFRDVKRKNLFISTGVMGREDLVERLRSNDTTDTSTIPVMHVERRNASRPCFEAKPNHLYPSGALQRKSPEAKSRLLAAITRSLELDANQPRLRIHIDVLKNHPGFADEVFPRPSLATTAPESDGIRPRKRKLVAQTDGEKLAPSIFDTHSAANTSFLTAGNFNPYGVDNALFRRVGDNFVIYSNSDNKDRTQAGGLSDDDDERKSVKSGATDHAGTTARSKTARHACTVVGNSRSVPDMDALSDNPSVAVERGGMEIHVALISQSKSDATADFSCQLETPKLIAMAGDLQSGKISISDFACGSPHHDPQTLRLKIQAFVHAEKEPKNLPVVDWIGDNVAYLQGALKNLVAALTEVFLLKPRIIQALRDLMDRAVKWANGVPRSAKVLKVLGNYILAEVKYVFSLRCGHVLEDILSEFDKIDVGYPQNAHVVLSMFELMRAHDLLPALTAPSPPPPAAARASNASSESSTIAAMQTATPRKRNSRSEKKAAALARKASAAVMSPAGPALALRTPDSMHANPFANQACPFFWSTKGCDASRKASKIACTAEAHRAVTGTARTDLLASMTRLHLTPIADF